MPPDVLSDSAQVPEQLRFEASEASAETRAAWATFMALEVEDARQGRERTWVLVVESVPSNSHRT